MNDNLIKRLLGDIERDRVIENAPMSKYTTFRAGGNAALLINPGSMAELFSAVTILKMAKVPYMVMGNGSNLLFKDEGYDGVVVRVGEGLDHVLVEQNVIFAEPGVKLGQLAKIALEHSLTGLEFASGIPGSLGGAVFMNAGAYGGEMKDVVLSTSSLRRNGMMRDRNRDNLGFGYRTSAFQGSDEIIIGVKILLKPGHPYLIQETMQDLLKKRNEKQPVNMPSAGSFFKRPEGHFAGKLIEDAGLKGLQVGGARVSPLHAGFVVNEGGATAQDILDLMKVVQETVKDKFGVTLEPEVRIIG
ncbi:MAG: UDP-N-acetylmuramate dehydrogenase [Firmicutes bacterium]|nr:UDP-N-acetylmuramate dehydrogenase [Bacillota bacterium]